jgi:hypothetical protein
MNLYAILSDTYYIWIHKLTTTEYHNTNIMNWHRTLKCPAQDMSESANRDLPSCDPSQLWEIMFTERHTIEYQASYQLLQTSRKAGLL